MGPSFTRLTDISAPNFPDSTLLNLLSKSSLKSVNNSWPVSGSAACEKLGLVPFLFQQKGSLVEQLKYHFEFQ